MDLPFERNASSSATAAGVGYKQVPSDAALPNDKSPSARRGRSALDLLTGDSPRWTLWRHHCAEHECDRLIPSGQEERPGEP